MVDRIETVTPEGIDTGFVSQIQTWANEVLERKGSRIQGFHLCITIWKTIERCKEFYQEEKRALGIVTGEEAEFLANHDAWRGYPRIHICQERLKGISASVLQGVIHHEIGHAIHHGTLEFYTFRFSGRLQETGRSCGLDMPLLQQCVYLVSLAIKDREVVQWLAEIGLGFGQLALLEHMICDTEEEHGAWEVVRSSPPLKKIALATFLKTLLPIEAMLSVGIKEAELLRNRWDEAYRWLSKDERDDLSRLIRYIMNVEGKAFQDRLEQAVLGLISLL
jgi:hypothetical protein